MQRLEFSGAVRPIYGSLGVKRLTRLMLETPAIAHTSSYFLLLLATLRGIKLSQANATLLYFFSWATPRRLNFICRRFGTLCSIFIGR